MSKKDEIIENIEEIEAVEGIEESYVETYKLSKPVEFEGIRYESITLDLESLTGKDAKEVLKELRAMGENFSGTLLETNKIYISGIAARAGNFPIELTDYLSIQDFAYLTMVTQNFLLGY